MKITILTTLFSVLLSGFAFAQSLGPDDYPRWNCQHNPLIAPINRTGETAFSCWALCEQPPFDVNSGYQAPNADGRIHACVDQVLGEDIGLDERHCEESLGVPAQCLPASSGGGTSNADKALIAGGVAIAVVAAYNFLYPETPEGVNVRPVANLAYRDGLAVSIAGLKGEWRNLEFSAMSANAGEGWTKPYARVQWTWAF